MKVALVLPDGTNMHYLASPYSTRDPFLREFRYLHAAKTLAMLLENKHWAYSPIVHCHELAKIYKLPYDAAFWEEYNHQMLSQCDSIIFLLLPDWQASKGMRKEALWAKALNLPMYKIEGTKDVQTLENIRTSPYERPGREVPGGKGLGIWERSIKNIDSGGCAGGK